MAKIAVVVLADVENHGDLGRVVNALELAKEVKESHDDLEIIFDGAGVQWVTELSKPDHQLHRLFNTVVNQVAGVCSFCARAFNVRDEVEACGFHLLDDYDGHPSLRTLVAEGYQVVTF
ncbi:MAG: hypothetical protein DCC55_22010 [Chloroflexi bacterium]|nr:MAG: hypothetical protein DCC55_22010 [Chloroflexota bacterium]